MVAGLGVYEVQDVTSYFWHLVILLKVDKVKGQ